MVLRFGIVLCSLEGVSEGCLYLEERVSVIVCMIVKWDYCILGGPFYLFCFPPYATVGKSVVRGSLNCSVHVEHIALVHRLMFAI